MISGFLGFLVAILILVSVHEYGHYIVARWFGVRVLRFSIGFGKPLLTRVDSHGTEFCIASIPLGGYVKFLDTREFDSQEALDNLSDEDRACAFDLQNVWKRIAIVFAGPLINFLFALVLFSGLSYGEKSVLLPVLGTVDEQTTVYQAGMREGNKIVHIEQQEMRNWKDVYVSLLKNSMSQPSVEVGFVDLSEQFHQTTLALNKGMVEESFSWQDYGLQPWQPEIKPVIDKIRQGHGVENSSLRENDTILSINNIAVKKWRELVEEVRTKANEKVYLEVLREGNIQSVEVTLGSRITNSQVIGFLGVQVALPSQEAWSDVMMTMNNGVFGAIKEGFNQTGSVINLIFSSIVGMVSGGVGLDNLGGPITIAQKAGESAQIGISAFVIFLAFLSVSLGVLNLLPIPLLDGGHIVLYLWEAFTGKVPSDQLQLVFQRVGFSIVIALTMIAIFNDLLRFGG